eukprot:comp5017_c0_seq1/m.4059 comp5017_c0_seq1/g.4059  ORF comp5017_c0_seq1/g.4059 comp5017_c0_seq1/m.4059 type:complete len:326 (-) comp5017_c0_seq1:810-1787(-)
MPRTLPRSALTTSCLRRRSASTRSFRITRWRSMFCSRTLARSSARTSLPRPPTSPRCGPSLPVRSLRRSCSLRRLSRTSRPTMLRTMEPSLRLHARRTITPMLCPISRWCAKRSRSRLWTLSSFMRLPRPIVLRSSRSLFLARMLRRSRTAVTGAMTSRCTRLPSFCTTTFPTLPVLHRPLSSSASCRLPSMLRARPTPQSRGRRSAPRALRRRSSVLRRSLVCRSLSMPTSSMSLCAITSAVASLTRSLPCLSPVSVSSAPTWECLLSLVFCTRATSPRSSWSISSSSGAASISRSCSADARLLSCGRSSASSTFSMRSLTMLR